MVIAAPDEAQALKSAGIGLFRNGDYHQALDLFTKALDRLAPDDAAQRSTLFCNLAITHNRLKQFAEAEREASAAIAANPTNAKAYYHRMVSRRYLQDQHGFRSDFGKFSQLKGKGDDSPDPGFLACIDAAVAQALAAVDPGDPFFLVAAPWWRRFRGFCGGTEARPGPIDNLVLIDERAETDDPRQEPSPSSKLDDALDDQETVVVALPPFDDGLVLRRDADFVAVPESVWKLLREQFDGGPKVRRPVIAGGGVQLRPISLAIQRLDDPARKIVVLCSPFSAVVDVILALCSCWTAAASELRAVRRLDGGAFEVVAPKLRLCDVCLGGGGATLFVERRTATGLWPCAKVVSAQTPGEYELCSACFDQIPAEAAQVVCETCQRAKYCSPRCRQSHSRWHDKLDHRPDSKAGRRQPGTSGLMNIGNSCYINAALQCLSSTRELTRVFLSDDFARELNLDNPLGCKGRLAEAYADLLKDMWFSDAPYADPREFKRAVSCFATQFAGCQQQDAQEFLAFLLDGIHEDLNRIRAKPYVPASESDGRPDEAAAQEQWSNYLARDQSVVIDCLLGQFKSEVVCAASPSCPASATFDPFMYVSLPLPEPVRVIQVLYYPVSGQVPTQIHVKVERLTAAALEAAVRPVLCALADFTPDNQLVCTTITNSRPLLFLPKTNQPIEVAASQELAVFECRPRHIPISCIIRQIPNAGRETSVLFRGRPFVVDFCLDTCPRLTGRQVYQRIYEYLRRSLYRPETEPSFWIEMFYNTERAVIEKTDDTVDLHYYMRPILVVTWKTDDVLHEVDMNELQRVERDLEGVSIPMANPSTSIYDCFKAFTKTESLGIDDWECSSCHKKGDASKRLSFWRLPDVLILHLKRFDSVRRHALFGEAANKISKEIEFPLKDLDLTPFLSMKETDQPIPRYELFGVINHFGASFFGHYTAFTKGLDGVWRHFDDDTVKIVPPEEICQSNAYVLFYRRQQE